MAGKVVINRIVNHDVGQAGEVGRVTLLRIQSYL